MASVEQKVLIIVPSYKEERNIKKVIDGFRKFVPNVDVLIIDDGSRDKTGQIAKEADVDIIRHPFNMGYGVAIQTGYKYALKHNYDIVVQFDGDGQHDHRFINDLIQDLVESKCDVVIGSRFLDGERYDAPFIRRQGIKLFSCIASLVTRQKLTDSTSGFQALSKRAFTYFARMDNFPCDYPDADLIINMCFAGLRVKEHPVLMHDRMTGQSMTAGFNSLIYIMKMFISILITVMRKRRIANGYHLMMF